MRTTLALDDDVLRAARQLADQHGQSLGAVISDLSRRSLTNTGTAATRNGITLLPVRDGAQSATLDEVNRLRDEVL